MSPSGLFGEGDDDGIDHAGDRGRKSCQPPRDRKGLILIDSGAIYSVVPTPILERLGIQPLTAQEFRLADGTKITRKKGIALFKYGDRIGGPDVIFGEEGDSVLLGAFTLEALGLSLDPLRRDLKLLPMILASYQRLGL